MNHAFRRTYKLL
jgi:hypothetical protein